MSVEEDLIASSWTRGTPAAQLTKLAGLAIVVFAIWAGLWSDLAIDGKLLWFVSAVGAGIAGAGYFGSEKAWTFGGIVLSLFVGGAAQLWLTQPLWFPSLTLDGRSALDWLMLALIVLQLVVALGVMGRRGVFDRLDHLIAYYGAKRPTIFFILSILFAVSPMGFLPRGDYLSWVYHAVAGGLMVAVNLASFAAMASLEPPFTKARGFHVLLPAAAVLIVTTSLSFFAFERMPHVEDELAYLFQAATFAHGHLTVPAPPPGAETALEYYLLDVQDGRWFAVTAPGWPAILALGTMIGLPWLVNPVLAMLSILFAHMIARRLLDARRADLVTLFLAVSPWFLAMGASLMPHTATLFLVLVSWRLLLVGRVNAQRRILVALGAGLVMGWAFLTRQLDGVVVGTMTGLWLLSRVSGPQGWPRVLAYSLGCILTGGLYFAYNAAITGNPLSAPLDEYLTRYWAASGNAFGFGANIGPTGGWGGLDAWPGHSPGEALLNITHNLSALQLEFLGWGVGSLALVFALLLWGRFGRTDRMMAALCVVIVLTMSLYWFSGGFYVGPRYWFMMTFPLAMLSANGFDALVNRIPARNELRHSTAIAVFMLAMFGLLVFTPWRGVEKYRHYGNYDSELRMVAQSGAFGNALVFVDTGTTEAGPALMLNDPLLPADQPVFLRDRGTAENVTAIAAFPGRAVTYFKSSLSRPRN